MANKRKLNELIVRRSQQPGLIWDTKQAGLALRIRPSGARSWYAIYSFHGRPRWLHLGKVDAIGLADARRLAGRVMLQVAEGKDPAAEKRAQRSRGTFAELAHRYVDGYAKRHNKSWQQADRLVRRHLLPPWGQLQAVAITRADVRTVMARITAPIVANQTLAAASAIFTWAKKQDLVTGNPCSGVERNPTTSRERVLAASELPKFWNAFDDAGLVLGTALKVVLLTGQRPGEVIHMRREHIVDGWWELPGVPVPSLDWPGTKNGESHRVWLSAPVQDLLRGVSDDDVLGGSGAVFAANRNQLDAAMRTVCAQLGVARTTPHDLRRTHGTTVTALGFGRDAMNRVQNHREGGIASVYDRHQYAEENKRMMEAVAAHLVALATGQAATGNVVRFNK